MSERKNFSQIFDRMRTRYQTTPAKYETPSKTSMQSSASSLMGSMFKRPDTTTKTAEPVIDDYASTLAAPMSYETVSVPICSRIGSVFTPTAAGLSIDTKDLRVLYTH
jgi:hypothetical protein